MIILYEGGLGSGKTYDAVRKIIANLILGRRILTNIDGLQDEINKEAIKHMTNLDDVGLQKQLIFLEKEIIPRFWEITKPNDMIVIDEVHKYFNSREWKNINNKDFGLWASEHRHNGQDVLLISPGQKKIESSVRDMAEWVYTYRKINMFGGLIQKKYIRFASYQNDPKPLGKKICTYNPDIFKCYKSYFNNDAKEVGIQKGSNILKHPVFILIPIVFIIFLFTLSKSSLFGKGILNTKDITAIKTPVKIEQFKPKQQPQSSTQNEVLTEDEVVLIGIVNGKRIIKTKEGIRVE